MIFLDSNIPMYLIGAPHANKDAARRALEWWITRGERLVTSAEVMQEILHRYVAIGRLDAIQPALERKLDEIEMIYPQQRDEYFKRDIKVTVGGQKLDCIVYEINPAYVQDKPVIASGDWVKDR